ncbi:MAG: RNA polymerase sigma factor [Bacteroidetes bacterium]|nr:RNA polymerase sigma factor [Bacteroidota bacterium]
MVNDAEIIKGCAKGNRAAQDQLYKTFASLIFGICLRYCGDYDEAKDVMQEGFIKVFTNISKFRNEGSLEGWIKRIIVNTALDHFKKKQKLYNHTNIDDINELLIENNEDIDPQEEIISEQELLLMIQSLPDGYRMVFNLYAIEDYSHKQIAEMLKISESTSKTQLFKARNLLQKKIQIFQSNKVLV